MNPVSAESGRANEERQRIVCVEKIDGRQHSRHSPMPWMERRDLDVKETLSDKKMGSVLIRKLAEYENAALLLDIFRPTRS